MTNQTEADWKQIKKFKKKVEENTKPGSNPVAAH